MNGKLHSRNSRLGGSQQAFTLLEMLMVLAIVGLLTGLTLPFLKGLNKSNSMSASARQLLDDVSWARHKAMAAHTTVFMIFTPPANANEAMVYDPLNNSSDPRYSPRQWTNLIMGQATSYSFFTRRAIGEQPGGHTTNYLTKWFSLPQGTFIPDYKFSWDTVVGSNSGANILVPRFLTSTTFPVPGVGGVIGGTNAYIAFDYMGRLVDENEVPLLRDEYIPVAQGSIFYERDANGGLVWSKADIQENPPNKSLEDYRLIHIEGLTGRAKIEQVQLPK